MVYIKDADFWWRLSKEMFSKNKDLKSEAEIKKVVPGNKDFKRLLIRW